MEHTYHDTLSSPNKTLVGPQNDNSDRVQERTDSDPEVTLATSASASASQGLVSRSYSNTEPTMASTSSKSLYSDADTELDQINAILDAIRLNLANVVRTWGRQSTQYRSAAAIMQSYLIENMERLRNVAGWDIRRGVGSDAANGLCGGNDATDGLRAGTGTSQGRVVGNVDTGQRAKEIEGGIEQLMRELSLD